MEKERKRSPLINFLTKKRPAYQIPAIVLFAFLIMSFFEDDTNPKGDAIFSTIIPLCFIGAVLMAIFKSDKKDAK